MPGRMRVAMQSKRMVVGMGGECTGRAASSGSQGKQEGLCRLAGTG